MLKLQIFVDTSCFIFYVWPKATDAIIRKIANICFENYGHATCAVSERISNTSKVGPGLRKTYVTSPTKWWVFS